MFSSFQEVMMWPVFLPAWQRQPLPQGSNILNKYGTTVTRKQSSEFGRITIIFERLSPINRYTPLKNKSLTPQIARKCYEVRHSNNKNLLVFTILLPSRETISQYLWIHLLQKPMLSQIRSVLRVLKKWVAQDKEELTGATYRSSGLLVPRS